MANLILMFYFYGKASLRSVTFSKIDNSNILTSFPTRVNCCAISYFKELNCPLESCFLYSGKRRKMLSLLSACLTGLLWILFPAGACLNSWPKEETRAPPRSDKSAPRAGKLRTMHSAITIVSSLSAALSQECFSCFFLELASAVDVFQSQ